MENEKKSLEKLHEWCNKYGVELGAVLIIRTDNLEDTIINCCSNSSFEEFDDKINYDF